MKYNKISAISTVFITAMFSYGVLATNLSDHPKNFTTKNYTPYKVNIKVGSIWSPFPTSPGSPRAVSTNIAPWVSLQALCGITATQCKVKFYVKSDSSEPIKIGESSIDLNTGEVTPSYLSANGFTLKSPEVGVAEITEDGKW